MSLVMNPFDSEKIWHEIVEDFRKVCHLRQRGNKKEAEAVMKILLPRRIACWARVSTYDRENQETVLKSMVKAEQREIQQRWLQHHVEADKRRRQLEAEIKQTKKDLEAEWSVCSLTSSQVLMDTVPVILDEIEEEEARQRQITRAQLLGLSLEEAEDDTSGKIQIDNVEGMIDMLLENQFGGDQPDEFSEDTYSSKPTTTSAIQPQPCNTL